MKAKLVMIVAVVCLVSIASSEEKSLKLEGWIKETLEGYKDYPDIFIPKVSQKFPLLKN